MILKPITMQKIFTSIFLFLFFLNAKSQCTDLFISEYIEGSASNKVIEIYNPTALPVNLSTYSLNLYSNGSPTVSATVALTGTLNPYSTYEICNGSSNAAILALSNQISSSVINFNGDDVIELTNATIPIDRIGIIGTDPGTSWTINGNTSGTLNKTLIRKANVQMGELVWTGVGENQWNIYNQDVINYLTFHVMNTCGSSLLGIGSGGNNCMDVASTFTALGNGGAGGYSYVWDYGDGTTQGNTATVSHNFAAAGTYNIAFVIYDAAFNVYSETFTLVVNPAPTACANVSGNNSCSPANICFTDCSTGATTYEWNFGDGNTGTTASPCNNFTIAGNYNASLITTNSFGCDDTTTFALTVTPGGDASFDYSQNTFCPLDSDPTPNITGNTGGTFSCNGCVIDVNTGVIDISGSTSGNYIVTYTEGTSPCDDTQTFGITINSSAPDATINSVAAQCSNGVDITLTAANTGGTWSATCGTCINATTGVFSPSIAGSGTHTITYQFTGSCATSDTEQIIVNPSSDATITPVAPICCDGSSSPITLNAVDAGGTWSATCGACINASTGEFTCFTAATGNNTITYTIAGGCGDIATTVITVNNPDFFQIYNSDTTICNDIFGFFLSAEVGGTWSGNNVTDNADGTGFFSSAAITPGTYYAVYSSSGSCSFEDSIAIDVFNYPSPNFTFSGTLGNISFTNTSTNATSYSWDFDDSGTSTQTSPTHVFALNGTYNVCLTATNAVGCENTTCQNVNVTGLGINETSTLKMNVYPNPSNGNFTVESNSIITKISVKNVIGQNVFTKNVNSNNTIISLEDVNNGFYFIELETENGKAVKRIEITK